MTVSKLVFPNFNFTGWGAAKNLLEEVKRYQGKQILCVTDKILVEMGIVEKVIKDLEDSQYEVNIYTEVEAEPSLKCAQNLVDYTKENNFDIVLGLGGGSTLDLAKLAAVFARHDGQVSEYLNLTGSKNITHKGLPLFLLPTTSGTGSEVTNISVLSLESTKDVIADDFLLADVAIIDPELTLTVPSKVTAATGVDALTHAIEAYLSVNANETTDALATKAVDLIGRSLKNAVKDGTNKEARTDMSLGSYMAGMAFFNAGVAGVHALAYPLGGQFNLAHGDSNAVLLPYVMAYIRSSSVDKMAQLYTILTNDSDLDTEDASIQFVKLLSDLVKDIKIPHSLKDFGIPKSALEQLTNDAMNQKRLLARSPMPLSKEDIKSIYQMAYDGDIRFT